MEVNRLLNIGISKNRPLNILTGCTHERYETGLCMTGHNFYAFSHEAFKPGWNTQYAPLPKNYHVLDKRFGLSQLPTWVDFDLVLSQNKFGQYQVLGEIANRLGLPLISLEHTLPMPGWPKERLEDCRKMVGNINVFISEYSVKQWGFEEIANLVVLRHMVDTGLFNPGNQNRKNHILTVANDYIGRDVFLNFTQYYNVCIQNNLPTRRVGDTQGFSLPAKDTNDLVNEYQTSRIFLNTAHVSPIPTSLLESMACGCAVVSCNSCAIPEYITHGENGFLANNDLEMLEYLKILLHDEKLANEMGKKARQTIMEKCNSFNFINTWNLLFRQVS